MNRYTELSTSQFNPLSLQEIMMVPTLKRQQHDEILNQQEILRQDLAKTDPDQKYFNEALRLKNDLNNQMESTADLLSSEGINDQTKNAFRRTYRQYQDLVGPTGKIGMINAHKINKLNSQKKYLEDGAKNHKLTPDEMQHYLDMADAEDLASPLYDETGRVKDYKIDKQLVDSVNYSEDFAKYATGLKASSTDIQSALSNIKYDDAKGITYVDSSTRRIADGSNNENVKSLINFITNSLNDPTSKYSKYADYARLDKKALLNTLKSQAGIYKAESHLDHSNKNISNLIQDPSQSGQTDGNPQIYSRSDGTDAIGNDYVKESKKAEDIMNNPDSTPQDKQRAQTIKDELKKIDDEIFGTDSNNLTDYQKKNRRYREATKAMAEDKAFNNLIAKYKTGDSATQKYVHSALTSLKDRIKRGDDISTVGWLFGNGVATDGGGNAGPNGRMTFNALELPEGLAGEVKSILKPYMKLHNEGIKELTKAKNEKLKTRGFENTVYNMSISPTEQKQIFLNASQAIDSNTFKLSDIQVYNNGKDSQKINLTENGSRNTLDFIKSAAQNGKLLSADVTTSNDGQVFITVEINADKDSKIEGTSFKAGEGSKIKARLPLTETRDKRTSLTQTGMMMLEQYPPALKQQVLDRIDSLNNGYIVTSDSKSNAKTPLNKFFSSANSDETVTFVKKNNNMMTPQINTNNYSQDLSWDFVDAKGDLKNERAAQILVKNYSLYFGSNFPYINGNKNLDYNRMLEKLSQKNAKVLLNSPNELEFLGSKY